MSKTALKYVVYFAISLVIFAEPVIAEEFTFPGFSIDIQDDSVDTQSEEEVKETATAFKLLLVLTILSLAPSFLIIATSFTRIIIVLSMLRHAFGMQQTPPNTVLISIALILTFFNMMPVFKDMNLNAFQPYLEGKLSTSEALSKGIEPLRMFMIKQTREQDMAAILGISDTPAPEDVMEIDTIHLVSAFLLSELKTAFQIGFVIFLPFLLVDLVVASILMSMGMIMVPPMMISLPLKVLMFVLIDGWVLVVQSLMGSFS